MAVLVCLLFSAASSLWSYPHSLSYFNEAVGGPGSRARLADSAIGWGQDLLYLKRWLGSATLAELGLASFGNVNPALVGIEHHVPPVGPPVPYASTRDAPHLGPHPGWYVVDVNHLIGTREPAMDRSGAFYPLGNSPLDYRYFQRFRPSPCQVTPSTFITSPWRRRTQSAVSWGSRRCDPRGGGGNLETTPCVVVCRD